MVFTKATYLGRQFPDCIGDYTYGHLKINGAITHMTIGKFCSFGPGIEIIGGGVGHNPDWGSTFPFFADEMRDMFPEGKLVQKKQLPKCAVHIGNDVWIGRDVKILKNVSIGDGVVIGTGALVSRDVPPYAVVVGNPAEVKKYRFEESIIHDLLTIEWWNWPIEVIREAIPLICSSHIQDLILFYEKNKDKIRVLKGE